MSDQRHSVAYLSDHMPQAGGEGPNGWGEYHDAAMDLAAGVDVLIHDAQYTAEELPARGAFGHAAAEYAVALGEEAGAKHVVLFHHDPSRTDDEVDAIVDPSTRCRCGCQLQSRARPSTPDRPRRNGAHGPSADESSSRAPSFSTKWRPRAER